MRHPLTDEYREGRERLLALAADLSESDGGITTTACPEWSVKDVYAHLAGIATDIVAGNTSEAATPGWADGHVRDRTQRTLAEVAAEWAEAGAEVSKVMSEFGDAFPIELFVDQWTHEWDVRSALGERAAARPDLSVYEHYLDRFGEVVNADLPAGTARLVLDFGHRQLTVGDGPEAGTMPLALFEFARITMGRRSAAQLASLPWPVENASIYTDALVRWSVNPHDVYDPAL